MRRINGWCLGKLFSVPVELVASESCRVSSVAVPDGQMQSHDGVTVRGVGKCVRRCNVWRLSEVFSVPIELVAGEGRCVAGVAVPDGQMQSHDGVTAGCVGECVRRIDDWSLSKMFSIPVELVASEGRCVASVGRKTANVVLSVAFDIPAMAVDTHVERVTKRLGLCKWKDNVLEVEETIMKKTPIEKWSRAHHQIIFFGRYHCKAQNPQCHTCPLLSDCREGQKRLKKGLVKSV